MTDLSGQSLGRYHILERLGEGGMATVYKAYDTRLERDVAIKIILPSRQQDEKTLKRFEREAKALAQLSHPHIVKVLDFGEQRGLHYLVMEYLPGGTLKTRLGHPIPWQKAVQLLLPIADALAFSHQHGIIHRDVKPSNLLFSETQDLMLSDFGIAKILHTDTNLTSTNMTLGTPEYMAPEQIHTREVDHRADIYSLGVVLYEALTGRKPFTAKTPIAVLIKSAGEPLPSPRLFVPDLPEFIENALIKALAKKPEDRFANIEGFASMLRQIEGLQPSISGRYSVFLNESIEDPEKTVDLLEMARKTGELPNLQPATSKKEWVHQDTSIICPFCQQQTTSNGWICSNCGHNLESVVLMMKRKK